MNSPLFSPYAGSPDVHEVQSILPIGKVISQPFSPLQFSFFHDTTSCAQTPQEQVKVVHQTPEGFIPYYSEDAATIFQQRQAFLRSLKYFSRLVDGRAQKTTPNLARGLFCCSRECCSLILDGGNRSPYCCKPCQVREQNMRQARVKARGELIERKRCLFQFLVDLKETDFERGRLVLVSWSISG
uniref:Uncharacterized protein n=1 Tax=Spironucleus salmonicida TaxID=348837 RepID=V6LU77_9EUKA|eukprot:EST48155.1 hypothetical protein SS50377_11672 [Spironucleus salmonicida]